MRVAMYYNNRDVRLEEMLPPRIGWGEILVKVIASGICGSDVVEWYRIKKAPRVLGHEITGEVVEVGEDVKRYRVGDRVFVSHHVPCNSCHYCLKGYHTLCDTLSTTNFDPGGFSEYLRVPAINVDRGVFKLPEEMSFDVGTFIEPLGCVVRGQRLAGLRPGQSVLVLGSGISGLLNILQARASGAGRVVATDTNEYRMRAAKKAGADVVLDARADVPELVREITGSDGVDLAIVCTSAPVAFEQAVSSVGRGGTLMLYALHGPGTRLAFDARELMVRGITIMSTYGAAPLDLEISMEMLRSGQVQVEDLITHRLPLEKTGVGFQLAAAAQESLKVIIRPTD